MPLRHNSEVKENEPQWGSYLNANRLKLPFLAYVFNDPDANRDKVSTWRFPHHWLVNAGGSDDNGRFTSGDMYLHRQGLNVAWAAAQGARTGKKASAAIISHLEAHRKAIGVEEVQKSEIEPRFRIMKKNTRNRVVVGVVYEPFTVDKQGHWADPETIERACHRFMMDPNHAVGIEHIGHGFIAKSEMRPVVECYIAPIDMQFGTETIKEGSWIMGVKILDDEEWEKVMRGELQGFSMQGMAQ